MIALILLATGISSVDLQNQTNYVLPTQASQDVVLLPASNMSDFYKVLGVVTSAIVILTIIYLIIDPKARKRFLSAMIPLTLLLIAIYYYMKRVQNANQAQTTPEAGAPQPPFGGQQPNSITIQPFLPSTTSPWLIFGVSLALVAVILLALFWVWRMTRPPASLPPLIELANSAQKALDSIFGGEDIREVILRCYREMNVIASEKRSVIRPDYLTPRAFTSKLAAAGLPADQVERLTRLFEAVRYGAWKPSRQDEQEAINCLEAVVATFKVEA